MEVNESHSPVFNRPFVRITDGSEETGDYLFVDIEVRQAIALRDALLERYPLPVQPDALKRLERWLCDALIGERKVEIEIDGRISYYCRIFDLRGSWYGESDDDLHAAVNEALDVAEGVNHE